MSTANPLEQIAGVALDWFDDGDVVTVTPRDQKRFEIQKDRAIAILQIADKRGKQFEFLVDRLGKWLSENADAIAGAYLTLQDGTLAFVVVRHEIRYEEAFQDELAELDFNLANDTELDAIRLKTLALPNVGASALRSFLDQRWSSHFMANEADHISLANRNHEFLVGLMADGKFPDWTATVAFYKAVHVVEAVFAADLKRDSTSHTDREDTLKISKYKQIFKNCTHLLTASRIARYLESRDVGKFNQFSDFMDAEAVNRLVTKRLYGVEQHCLKFLTDNGKGLNKVDSH